jgi:hypothetical protein
MANEKWEMFTIENEDVLTMKHGDLTIKSGYFNIEHGKSTM